MAGLFEGEPQTLPEPHPTGRWQTSSEDPPRGQQGPIRHGAGYEPFVDLVTAHGVDPRALFDLWLLAHVLRAHRSALESDAVLMRAAVVFLGNVLIAAHPECRWTAGAVLMVEEETRFVDDERGVRYEPEGARSIRVGGTVPALLAADEQRFLEWRSVVEAWRPGAPRRTRRRVPVEDQAET